jgi:hypothetical protein
MGPTTLAAGELPIPTRKGMPPKWSPCRRDRMITSTDSGATSQRLMAISEEVLSDDENCRSMSIRLAA